ncbi:hypothetical protein MLD38_022492 [Melastoma candidum]|uniref:Uncharacterized protein n=1 Tax=Melastoma candidum TaxID=119954 RepID=A0ACB9QSJ8_9MYRT|nr:hypothetical protein MLD38_022492 [Melastoma candidum]
MASKAFLFLVLVISVLLLNNSVMSVVEESAAESAYPPPPPPPPPRHPTVAIPPKKSYQFCVQKCEARCKGHRRIKPCMKACTHCCKRSNQCVPPGTSGNQQACSNWTYIAIHGVSTQCP